jgi:catechol 1,2-dioxygenase
MADMPLVIDGPDRVTDVVLHAMSQAPDPRLRQIMDSLVHHLHGFARDVKLTEQEWEVGIEWVTGLGKQTTDTHNETILASDILGLSTLVVLLNNRLGNSTETGAALLGPFWRMHSPETVNGGSLIRSPTPGALVFVQAKVIDPSGKPLAGVEVDVWQASSVGMYENQDPGQADMNLRGKFHTDAEGRFWFQSIKPAGYPIPIDGPVGRLLAAQRRHNFRPAHFHFLLYQEGFKTLVTQIFVADDPKIDSDVVFGVTEPLIGNFVLHQNEPAPDPAVTGDWYSLDATFVMEPGEAKLPHPPIQ